MAGDVMEHKTSVREYLPKIRHHCKVAERHERATRRARTKKKRKRHTNIARKHRRICANLAHVWTAQVAWNRQHWNYVFDKMYGPNTVAEEENQWLRELSFEHRIDDDIWKAKFYDFWGSHSK